MIPEHEVITAAEQLLVRSELWPSILQRVDRTRPPFIDWGSDDCWLAVYTPTDALLEKNRDIVFPGDQFLVLVQGQTGEARFFSTL